MKYKYITGILWVVLLLGTMTGCSQKNSEITPEQTVTTSEAKAETETVPSPDMSAEEGTIYSMKTENSDYPAPSLKLFDNGRFGFYYDVLSSYYPHGSYEIKDDKLTAVTDDGKYRYVFKSVSGQYVFVQAESSEVGLTDEETGVSVTDGAVFALEQPEEGLVQMTAVVKEVTEGSLLVTSCTDQYPGAYYVHYGKLDISGIKGGDKILIEWNGSVQETYPAQISAEKLEKIED